MDQWRSSRVLLGQVLQGGNLVCVLPRGSARLRFRWEVGLPGPGAAVRLAPGTGGGRGSGVGPDGMVLDVMGPGFQRFQPAWSSPVHLALDLGTSGPRDRGAGGGGLASYRVLISKTLA